MAVENVKLNNGVMMPLEGFGVFQIPDLAECERVTIEAIRQGYRLIDTAAVYQNEEAFERSLQKLGLDYLDLYLIHQPMGDFFGAWRRLEELHRAGKIRAIGVSNFYPAVLANFCETVEIKPMANQVELHPFFQQEAALATMKEYGVVPQAWGPLAEGKHGIFTHPVLTKIGEKYGKTAAQVALRWNTQRGVSILPKSVRAERIAVNLDIWDFALNEAEMAEIAKLDLGHSEIVNHDDPAFVKWLHERRIHD